jgi:hypothetical protein
VPHPLRFLQRVGGAQLIRKENFGWPILCGFAFGKGWGFFFFVVHRSRIIDPPKYSCGTCTFLSLKYSYPLSKITYDRRRPGPAQPHRDLPSPCRPSLPPVTTTKSWTNRVRHRASRPPSRPESHHPGCALLSIFAVHRPLDFFVINNFQPLFWKTGGYRGSPPKPHIPPQFQRGSLLRQFLWSLLWSQFRRARRARLCPRLPVRARGRWRCGSARRPRSAHDFLRAHRGRSGSSP